MESRFKSIDHHNNFSKQPLPTHLRITNIIHSNIFTMGVAAARYQDTYFDSDSPATKTQCKQDLRAYIIASKDLAEEYKELGEAYHELPLLIRDHQWVAEEWREYCRVAFIVEQTREIPDMLQILDMLYEQMKRVQAAMNCEDVVLAGLQLQITYLLLVEARHRIDRLAYALCIHDVVMQEVEYWLGLRPEVGHWQANQWWNSASNSTELAAEWRKALPKNLRGKFCRHQNAVAMADTVTEDEAQSAQVLSPANQSPRTSNADSGVGLQDEV